jgi:hypothetical protein
MLTEYRPGRASEGLDEMTTKKDAALIKTLRIAALQLCEACPNAETN